MTPDVSAALLVYGPLGIMVLGLAYVCLRLYRDVGAQRESNAAQIERLQQQHLTERTAHSEELSALQERFIEKADAWNTKYHESAKALAQLLEAATRHKGDRS